jgi:hypothetical protein
LAYFGVYVSHLTRTGPAVLVRLGADAEAVRVHL